jgi:YD repeat-containing protein
VARLLTPSSYFLRIGAAILIAAIAEVAPGSAFATVVTSAANIPYSGISPGGVDMATGELILVMHPDLVVNGPFPIVFQRYYASMLQREGFASGRLGPNWIMTYDWKLALSPGNARLVTNRGELIRFTMGPAGGWDLVSPTYARFKLDQVGASWRVTNPVDRYIYFFDGTGLLTQILDEHGNTLTLSYAAGGGALTQVSDGLGRTITFGYDPTGLLTQVTDGTRSVLFQYTLGTHTSVLDTDGKPWTYSYQTPPDPVMPALLIGVMEPAGNIPFTHEYDPLGRVSRQSDALSHIATYAYDTPTGNVYTDPQGNPWTYQHDPLRLTSLKDPNSGSTNYFYDPSGRLATIARPMGDPTSFDYDPASGYVGAVHYPDGNSVFFDHGPHGVGGATIFDITAAHYPDGANVTYGRDAAGNLTNYLDQASFPWTGTYNARGQILTWTNPSSGVTIYTYDTQGRPATVQDNAGNTASYIYDPLSRLTQVNWPGGSHRQFTYDNRDNLTLVQDESGNPWTFVYDDNGRLTTATDPLLHATGFVYDNVDRLSQVVDPLGHATLYDYDLNGRLYHETDRSGRATTYSYDALNRLTSVADPEGAPTTFGHDGDGRVIFTQDALGHSAGFQYDFMDRLTHMTDEVTSEFDYSYDPMGRLRQVIGPLGLSRSFRYDPRGLLISAANGTSTVQYEYTPHRRVSQITDPNGNPWPRSYDPQGRLESAADPLGRTYDYEYDGLSRLIRITRPDLTAEQIAYDSNGNVTGRSFTDGTTFTYGYDTANRMTNASPGVSFSYDNAGRMTASNGFTYTHDFEGRILSETLAPGKTVSYSYESRGLVSQVQDWMGGTTPFTYDAAQRLTGMTPPDGIAATYQYDAADRLISQVDKDPGPVGTPPLASIAITRDALGQPTSIDRRQPLMPGATSPATKSFDYDAASQINGISHDALGRTTGDGSRTFQWDGASRLTRFTADSDSPQYAYDAFGHVLTSTQGNQTVQRAWNYGHNPPTNDDTQVSLPTPKTSYNVRTPSGHLLYGVDGTTGARSFYHYDESGNTMFLTNDAGSVVTQYAYEPFGDVTVLGQAADNPFTYGAAAEVIQLGSSGLFRMGGGIYDAKTMRVISGPSTQSGPEVPEVGKIWAGAASSFYDTEDPLQLEPQPARSGPASLPDILPPGPCSPGLWAAVNPAPDQNGNPAAPMDGSGGAEIGGQTFAGTLLHVSGHNISLGHGGKRTFEGVPIQDPGTLDYAGTLLHELGHTFGLDHGGSFDPGKRYAKRFAVFGHSVLDPDHDGLGGHWEDTKWIDWDCNGQIHNGSDVMIVPHRPLEPPSPMSLSEPAMKRPPRNSEGVKYGVWLPVFSPGSRHEILDRSRCLWCPQ